MIRIAFPMILAVMSAGCTAADASTYDSNNPVHCLTVFGIASAGTRTGPIADDMNARILFIVQANGGATWLGNVTPASQRLGAQWEASVSTEGDKVMTLLDSCRARQDADPAFRRSRAALLREGRQISAGAR